MGTQTIVMAYPPIIPINIDVRGAIAQMSHLTKQLNENEIKKATSRAINRTLTHLRAKIVKEVPKVYALKGFQVRDRFEFTKANKNSLFGNVKSVSNRISASNFDNRLVKGGVTTKITRSKRGGIGTKKGKGRGPDSLFIRIYKRQPAKAVGSVFMMKRGGNPFFAFRGKYNKTDQYQKAEFSGRRVKGLLTQSVWDMAVNPQVQFPTSVDGSSFFIKRFEHEVNNLIRLKTQVP